jgi:Zn-dependent protease/predicted transcriptional regulator
MKSSLKFGTFADIKVYIHPTFVLLLLFFGFLFWRQGNGFYSMLEGLLFILTLFGCVLLHEFGHALTAKKYGIKTKDIVLLPIGGVARLERMPEKPLQELLVALAGPMVNLVIASVIFVGLRASQTLEPLQILTATIGPFVERVMSANIFLALFNMLPSFPMDGGRVLRALLALRLGYARATHYAATLGQGMAVLFGFLGFFVNPMLLLIAIFVWFGAAQEATLAKMKSSMDNITVKDATITQFATLRPSDPLKRAIDLTLATAQKDFPVVEDGEVKGMVVQDALFKNLQTRDEQSPVSQIMVNDFLSADYFDILETAFMKLKSCNCQTFPVLRNGLLIGLLTMDNVDEFLKIQTAMGKVSKRREWGIDAV